MNVEPSPVKQRIQRPRPEYSVGIGFPCKDDVPFQTTMSLTRTVHYLTQHGVPLDIHAVWGSSLVTIARDRILDAFLESMNKYLFWIDSDIVWTPADFLQVLGLTSKLGLVVAAYPLKRDAAECVINFEGCDPQPNEHGCVEVAGLGLGFTCVRRDLMEAFAATKEKMYHAGNNCMITDAFNEARTRDASGQKRAGGEDGQFFADMRALGYKAWLVPTISLGHAGSKEYRVKLEETDNPHLPTITPQFA